MLTPEIDVIVSRLFLFDLRYSVKDDDKIWTIRGRLVQRIEGGTL